MPVGKALKSLDQAMKQLVRSRVDRRYRPASYLPAGQFGDVRAAKQTRITHVATTILMSTEAE